MKKLMFNDKYCLTQAVLNGEKTMTRRVLRDDVPLGNWEETAKHLPYKVGDVVAIAQSYLDIGKPQFYKLGHDVAGNTNKMFVRADLMPHHVKITDVKVERLQDISDEDVMREGVREQIVAGNKDYYFETDKVVAGLHCTNLIFFKTPRKAFAYLIDKVSGKGTWESNPWVVAYSFELID